MPAPHAATYRSYQAPQADGAALVEPGWPDLRRLIEDNHRRAGDSPDIDLGALSVDRAEARAELLTQAHEFTRAFCDPPPLPADHADQPLILSGHQPELFHPGVWFKNFALDRLASDAGGVGVHLLIDSDLCRRASVRAPAGPVDSPRVEAIALDDLADEAPYEERAVQNVQRLGDFGARVAQTMEGLVDTPLALSMASDLLAAAQETVNLGLTLSRVRRIVEDRHGAATLELPISAVCDTSSFHQFVAAMLGRTPEVPRAYNGALASYRDAHRLRTSAQPLPDLTEEDGWWETPFWVWTRERPIREPLFIRRQVNHAVQLTNRAGDVWSHDGKSHDAASWLAELREQGVKIRGRALITTLYARLVLSDLFLHGIGGAKYDEVTDDFARRLLGQAPPPHATFTATLRLPIAARSAEEFGDYDTDAQLRRQLRELRFHPEQFVADPDSATERLIAEKQAAIATPKTPENAAERHRQIERVNLALQPQLERQRQAAIAQRESLATEQRAHAVLASREYSFCLFPEQYICERLRSLAAPS